MKRCLVIKTYGDPVMADGIAQTFKGDSEREPLSEKYKDKKVAELYERKIQEAKLDYAIEPEPLLKRWYEKIMATCIVFLQACAKEAETEER